MQPRATLYPTSYKSPLMNNFSCLMAKSKSLINNSTLYARLSDCCTWPGLSFRRNVKRASQMFPRYIIYNALCTLQREDIGSWLTTIDSSWSNIKHLSDNCSEKIHCLPNHKHLFTWWKKHFADVSDDTLFCRKMKWQRFWKHSNNALLILFFQKITHFLDLFDVNRQLIMFLAIW